jgi:effector-binding domain-containing protein
VHHGSYDQLTAAWAQLEAWMREHDLEPAPSSWEVYLTEPSPDMDPADLRTQLVWPTTG